MLTQSQLPLLVIVALIGLFFLPVVVALHQRKYSLDRRILGFILLLSIALTFASLMIDGTRGGQPPSTIYGWPKELISIRAGEPFYLFFSHAIVDLAFYVVVLLGLFNLNTLISSRDQKR